MSIYVIKKWKTFLVATKDISSHRTVTEPKKTLHYIKMCKGLNRWGVLPLKNFMSYTTFPYRVFQIFRLRSSAARAASSSCDFRGFFCFCFCSFQLFVCFFIVVGVADIAVAIVDAMLLQSRLQSRLIVSFVTLCAAHETERLFSLV